MNPEKVPIWVWLKQNFTLGDRHLVSMNHLISNKDKNLYKAVFIFEMPFN